MHTKVYPKTFLWLFAGLLITFLTGYFVGFNPNMLYNIANMWYILIILELFAVIYLSARITKMHYGTAILYYLLYCFITGLTFSSIFVVFQIQSIMFTFGVTALLFGAFAFLGYVTKIDLSKISTMLFMGLIGIILVSIVNIFLGNSTLDIILGCIGLILFVGYTAYDIQKIKYLQNTIDENKLPIYGALQLYLDFINIFMYLLRLFGRGSDS
ncbi:MAG: Bax inhibitor-1/YccA family protein [Bacilli bacterium]|nr:Bax inhibitor-1/YccA family protein [Bacilli bacterium]